MIVYNLVVVAILSKIPLKIIFVNNIKFYDIFFIYYI